MLKNKLVCRLQDLGRALCEFDDGLLGFQLQLELIVRQRLQVEVDLVIQWNLLNLAWIGLADIGLHELILRFLKQVLHELVCAPFLLVNGIKICLFLLLLHRLFEILLVLVGVDFSSLRLSFLGAVFGKELRICLITRGPLPFALLRAKHGVRLLCVEHRVATLHLCLHFVEDILNLGLSALKH